MLAFRAVTIATRVIAVPGFITVRAVIDMTTQGFRPTLLDGPHGSLLVAATGSIHSLVAYGVPAKRQYRVRV